MKLHTFNTDKLPGWDGTNDPATLTFSQPLDVKSLEEPLVGDSRFVVYTIEDTDEPIPRLNLPVIPVLEGMGTEAVALVAVVDVDLPNHRQWKSLDEAAEHIETNILDVGIADEHDLLYAAAYYTTRAGYRLMWKLSTPLPVTKYRSLMRLIMKKLKDDYDIDCDPSSDEWTRFFRMPCCMRDGVQLETVADLTPLTDTDIDPYSLGELQNNEDFITEIAGNHPSDIAELDLKAWGAAHRHPHLKRGQPFPPDAVGSTYTSMRRAIASLAHEGPCGDAEQLFAMVHQSVEATPGRKLQEAWKMCVWTAARQRGKIMRPPAVVERPLNPAEVEPAQWSEWFRTVDKRYAPTLSQLRSGLAYTPKSQAESKLLKSIFTLATKLRITDAELLYRMFYKSAAASKVDPLKVWEQCEQTAAIAQEQLDKTATEDEKMATMFCLDTPLTIAIPGTKTLYQLDLRDPSHPTYGHTDKNCLLLHYYKHTDPNLPFDADMTTDKGMARPLELILLDYGESAAKVRYVTAQKGAAFIPNTDGNAIEIGVHALYPQLVAREHPEVDKWLRLFGGSDPERFLDWLATCTYTSFPTCALYVHGHKGSGKSMLVEALAAMWGGTPVPFKNVAADFNEALLTSPIISADEGVGSEQGDLSETFRNLVGNSQHDIRIKFQSNASLHSCMRLLITANEADGLDFKKALSGRSLEAIAERVTFIEQDKTPANYLVELGGRAHTAEWATRAPSVPGLIGEHVLWLKTHREVERGSRFLVAGHITDWHRQFISQQGIKPDIIKVIALAAKQAARATAASGSITPGVQLRADKGCVLITKEAVVCQWKQHGDRDPPRERILNKTLRQMCEASQVGIRRPRIGRGNASQGQGAFAITFDTLVASQYVTLEHLNR